MDEKSIEAVGLSRMLLECIRLLGNISTEIKKFTGWKGESPAQGINKWNGGVIA